MSSRKGKKAVRNIPLFHDEVKKRHHVLLTPTAWQRLQDLAASHGTSASELIEFWATMEAPPTPNNLS